MNNVSLVGRLTRDPETREAGETTIVAFTVAVDRRFKSKDGKTADFISCKAFGKTGEGIAQYFHKGKPIAITGRLQQEEWEKDGVKQSKTGVVVEAWCFVPSDKGGAEEGGGDSDLPF